MLCIFSSFLILIWSDVFIWIISFWQISSYNFLFMFILFERQKDRNPPSVVLLPRHLQHSWLSQADVRMSTQGLGTQAITAASQGTHQHGSKTGSRGTGTQPSLRHAAQHAQWWPNFPKAFKSFSEPCYALASCPGMWSLPLAALLPWSHRVLTRT